MEKGVFAWCPAARRAPAASGSTEEEWIWFSAGGDAFWFGRVQEELDEGRGM